MLITRGVRYGHNLANTGVGRSSNGEHSILSSLATSLDSNNEKLSNLAREIISTWLGLKSSKPWTISAPWRRTIIRELGLGDHHQYELALL